MNIVITGTSRGIGLELSHLALAQGHHVCAVARDTKNSSGLQKLASEYGANLSFVDTDVTDPNAARKILDSVGKWAAVDLLINNAGIFENDLTEAAMLRSFQVNSIAPLVLTQALLAQLKKSARPVVGQITSKMGSIDDNTSGGYYAYRASKAALNMFNKSLAIDNPWLTSVVIHPGWVQTDMGGANATTSVHDSAQGIWKVLTGKLKSGGFVDFQGAEIEW